MNRRLLIMILALAAFGGLYLYDRDNSTQTILPGTVEQVQSQSPDAGADIWLVTVTIGETALTLAPLSARPTLKPGDRICVTRISRAGQPPEYRRAASGATC